MNYLRRLLAAAPPALLAAVSALVFAEPAAAHHPMGGAIVSTFGEGLLSGLGHPVIGLDHLAFVVGVGLIAATLGRPLLAPLAFVGATILGVAAHLLLLDLPLVEPLIALSVAAIGLALIYGNRLASGIALGLFGVSGLFHGYAYGESIVGAETTPLVAYFIGFSAIQYAIAAGVALAALRFGSAKTTATGAALPAGLRIAGGVVAGIGLVFLRDSALPF